MSLGISVERKVLHLSASGHQQISKVNFLGKAETDLEVKKEETLTDCKPT